MRTTSKIILMVAVFVSSLGSFYVGTKTYENTITFQVRDQEVFVRVTPPTDGSTWGDIDVFLSGNHILRLWVEHDGYHSWVSTDPTMESVLTLLKFDCTKNEDNMIQTYSYRTVWIDGDLYNVIYDDKGEVAEKIRMPDDVQKRVKQNGKSQSLTE